MKIVKLKYPYPYKAWFTILSDPDHTTLERWQELHNVLWQDLGLPLGDSLFVKSYNRNIPDQVNLFKHKDAILKHSYDSIHTWGDYVAAEDKVFKRSDALEASGILIKYNIKPLVWVDHSSFTGNFLKNSNRGAQRYSYDAAGYKYENLEYSLDIANDLGIRYLWDGYLTNKIQCPEIFRSNKRKKSNGFMAKVKRSLLSRLFKCSQIKEKENLNNFILTTKYFGSLKLYTFRRYGNWNDAHIDGVSKLLTEKYLNKLVKKEGVSVLYTHLGKRLANNNREKFKIPLDAYSSFVLLNDYYKSKLINISSTSKMLDYIVLSNNVEIDCKKNEINFRSDGIRFNLLVENNMKGQMFSFKLNGIKKELTVLIEGKVCENCKMWIEDKNIMMLSFS